jgi:hypothetical protein
MADFDLSEGRTDAKDSQNLRAITADTGITGRLFYKGTVDVASLTTGASTASSPNTFTVPGAKLGDIVSGVSLGISQALVVSHGYVSAANTVTVLFHNLSGSTVNLASTTIRITVDQV